MLCVSSLRGDRGERWIGLGLTADDMAALIASGALQPRTSVARPPKRIGLTPEAGGLASRLNHALTCVVACFALAALYRATSKLTLRVGVVAQSPWRPPDLWSGPQLPSPGSNKNGSRFVNITTTVPPLKSRLLIPPRFSFTQVIFQQRLKSSVSRNGTSCEQL
jgi:hypothetical protein